MRTSTQTSYTDTLRRAALLGLVALAAPLGAQESAPPSKLTIHGYLTQGAAVSSDLTVLGIPTTGTQDYRQAALQFRYAVSAKDNIVLQLKHSRVGDSPLSEAEDDVALGWGFYERRFDNGAFAKVGRVPIPRGIFNEFRNVGTALPFYRAPYQFYTNALETVDGAAAGYRGSLGDWGVEATGYAGSWAWQMVQTNTGTPELMRTVLDHTLGAQLWVRTPIDGLRVGVGGMRFTPMDGGAGVGAGATDEKGKAWQASIDGDFDRLVLRGEFARITVQGLTSDGAYVQGGLGLTERLRLNAQAEYGRLALPTPIGLLDFKDQARDYALGLNMNVSSNLVLKLEGHDATGYWFDEYVDTRGPVGKTKYGVASVSVSF